MVPNRILVRTPNWIGDQVMAGGFYENLRSYYAHSHITWLMRESLVGLGHCGLANEILPLPERARSGFGLVEFAKGLKKSGYDLALSLPASLSSALMFFLAGVPERVGFAKDGSDLFFTACLSWKGRQSGKHKSQLYLDFFEFLTGRKADLKSVKGFSPRGKKIIVAPGASIRLREWPYFEELLGLIRRQFPGYLISVVGAKESVQWHEKIASMSDPHVEDLVEKTSLTELIKACEEATLVIANDSGVAHAAASLGGAKTLVIYGPGDPIYIAPQGEVLGARLEDLPCSPCEKPYCYSPYGWKACLNQLSAEKVFSLVERALVGTS